MSPRLAMLLALLAIGCASSAAHIGNNFTTYLIGGLVDRYGFSATQMGAFSMAETLSYAVAMLLAAPRAARLSARGIAVTASLVVMLAQGACWATGIYPLLIASRIAVGFGFGMLNCAVNLAAGRTGQATRAISAGIALQTLLFAAANIVLPRVGEQYGVGGMFLALAGLSGALGLGALLLPADRGAARVAVAGTAVEGAGTAHTAGAVTRAPAPIDARGGRILAAMALFSVGSMAIWPFMERAAHAIGVSAVQFGRYQAFATLMSAVGSLGLTVVAPHLRRSIAFSAALAVCGGASALLTTTDAAPVFAAALVVYNVSWFFTYPLLIGLAFAVDGSGRLAVTASGTWLLSQSLGSLGAGIIADNFGGYAPIGPLGLVMCLVGVAVAWPVASGVDRDGARTRINPAS